MLYNVQDILETTRMITENNLDVRTITMGISLRDCCHPDIKVTAQKIYDKICTNAEKLVKNGEKYAVAIGGVTVELSDEKQARLQANNVEPQDVTLGVRPDHLMLCADGIKGTVDVSELMGSSVHLHITAEGKDVIVIVPTNGAAANFPMGSEVNLIFGGNVAHVFSKETGKNLEW